MGNVRQAGRQAGRVARRDRAIIERGAERDRSMQQERERTIVLLDGRLAGAWRVSASELEENGGARARRHASTTITHGHDQRQRGEEDGGAVMVERAREAVHADAAPALSFSLSRCLRLLRRSSCCLGAALHPHLAEVYSVFAYPVSSSPFLSPRALSCSWRAGRALSGGWRAGRVVGDQGGFERARQ